MSEAERLAESLAFWAEHSKSTLANVTMAQAAAVLRRLAATGPVMRRGTDGAGNPWMGTMLDVLNDYKAAAEVEAAERCRLTAENEALREANTKLVGAIDLIRETMNGGNVDDLAYIINQALDAARPGASQEKPHD